MATILLSAAGAAIGSGVGGTVLGLSGAVIGRAVGATVGRVIDQKIMGSGSEAVEIGRLDRLRMMGASEGAAVPRVWGRVRIAGQVIWASRFQENITTSGGGKGSPRPKSKSFSYSVSLAIGLCAGQINSIGRIWADGSEIEPRSLNYRVYDGSEDQLPDPKIAVVEGATKTPSYRGIAYVVIEDLDLTPFGNRVPQFSFEVVRNAQGTAAAKHPALSTLLKGVCIIPGTGEYALATTPVHYALGLGRNVTANVHSAAGVTDFAQSLEQLNAELPQVASASLVVSWFGDDLRCSQCQIKPKVEQTDQDGIGMPWRVNALPRATASVLAKIGGASIYGGTPSDASVVEAIVALKAAGKAVTFYPFILMEQLADNQLPDPWMPGSFQPALPWRGRITLDIAPGRNGTSDRSILAQTAVTAFFGTAQVADFGQDANGVTYSGSNEWRYRRFILHYAKLCAIAGGVESFCIGSEMRSLTQIRGLGDIFPAVQALKALANDVSQILGPQVKITYAADWSEYFGYQADGNVYFHLDPLWSDPNIDYIGIDNYMPLADWRDGSDHIDAHWKDTRNVGYLKSNIAGGEGFDWYYDGPEGEAVQNRKPISDDLFNEPWVFRYKDLKGWWGNAHYERQGSVRATTPTNWQPYSKPIRFTEYGCAAIEKGANQPNRFLDPKSSESGLPKYSNGTRDDLMQIAYFQAMAEHWVSPENNPVSPLYGGAMLDIENSLAWAWDARPFPTFPLNSAIWSDGDNYDRGHWINGRSSGQQLAGVLAEVCAASGLDDVDAAAAYGIVRGYSVADVATARSILQPLLLAANAEIIEKEGRLCSFLRNHAEVISVDLQEVAISTDIDGRIEQTRASSIDLPQRIAVSYIEAEGNHLVRVKEAVSSTAAQDIVLLSELPFIMTDDEATTLAEQWLTEAQLGRETLRLALPRSQLGVSAGNRLSVGLSLYRVDRVELGDLQIIDATKVKTSLPPSQISTPQTRQMQSFLPDLPVYAQFMDLPILQDQDLPYAPYVCATAVPWTGDVAIFCSSSGEGFVLNQELQQPAIMGITESELRPAPSGVWDNGPALRVRIDQGSLSSGQMMDVLSGENTFAVGDGSVGNWEIVQFVKAELISPNLFEVSMRLRGQLGSDVAGATSWPVGSVFVLLTNALKQLDLPSSARGLAKFFRVGWAAKGFDHPSVIAQNHSFDGIGLRPFSIAHLRALRMPSEVLFTWIRRTRKDGDSWLANEVPLSETEERYTIKVLSGATVVREVQTGTTSWSYTDAMKATDGVLAGYTISVAQVSTVFGDGPYKSVQMG